MNPKGIPPNYVKNHEGVWCHPSRVGRLLPAKPEQDSLPALDQKPKMRKAAVAGVVVSVVIIRRGQRLLDDDNLAFAYKGLRDAIAWSLDIDDADPRITWAYQQLVGKPYGTIVQIHAP